MKKNIWRKKRNWKIVQKYWLAVALGSLIIILALLTLFDPWQEEYICSELEPEYLKCKDSNKTFSLDTEPDCETEVVGKCKKRFLIEVRKD